MFNSSSSCFACAVMCLLWALAGAFQRHRATSRRGVFRALGSARLVVAAQPPSIGMRGASLRRQQLRQPGVRTEQHRAHRPQTPETTSRLARRHVDRHHRCGLPGRHLRWALLVMRQHNRPLTNGLGKTERSCRPKAAPVQARGTTTTKTRHNPRTPPACLYKSPPTVPAVRTRFAMTPARSKPSRNCGLASTKASAHVGS